MSGIDTTEIEHNLRLFHQGKTDRQRLLVAIGGEENHLTVGSNTDCLARIFLSVGLI